MRYTAEFLPCRIESPEGEPADQVAVHVYEVNADGSLGRLVDSCGPWPTVDKAIAEMNAWAEKMGHTLTFFGDS